MAVLEDYSKKDVIIGHYDRLADKYDQFYGYRNDTMAELAIKWTSITPNDKVVDIGGGSGGVAEIIKTKAGLKTNVLVVDPSPKSIEKAKEKPGLAVMLADATQFLDSDQSRHYNKYLLFHCVHHISDQKSVFSQMYQRLPLNGQLLIILYDGEKFPLPLWKEAYKKRSQVQPLNKTIEYLEAVGFTVVKGEEIHEYVLNKEKYFYMIRHRIYTVLEFFTDEEIEAGITEISEALFKDSDTVNIKDCRIIICAEKRKIMF